MGSITGAAKLFLPGTCCSTQVNLRRCRVYEMMRILVQLVRSMIWNATVLLATPRVN